MNKIISFIILSIILWISPVYSENPRQECMLNAIIGSLNLSLEHFHSIANHLKMMDFHNDSVVNKSNVADKLDLVDSSTYSDIQFLITSEAFLPILKPLIKQCELNVARTKRRCEKVNGEGNCEPLTPFIYAKKCEPGFNAVGVGYCVPPCPVGFLDDKKDPFLCKKSYEIARSIDVVEPPVSGIPKFAFYRNVKYFACPNGYHSWGIDFCYQKCPLGFTDLGMYCEKPLVQRREYELFIYDVSVDDFLVEDTHEMEY